MYGTEKQIAWAETIKENFIANIRKFDVNEIGENFINSLTENAHAWIDARSEIKNIEFASGLGEFGVNDELWIHVSKKPVHGRKILALIGK